MLRKRRLRVAYLLGSLLLLTASLHAPTAYSAPGDPPAGSPAGAVYQLPLEQGRADGAPKGGGGTSSGPASGGAGAAAGTGSTGSTNATGSTGAAGTAEAGSLYRTENNFGSSSHVPGLAAIDAAGANGGGPGRGGVGAAAGGAASAGAAIAGGAVAGEVADSGNTSVAAGIVLLGAIGLIAAAVGALSRRASKGRAGA